MPVQKSLLQTRRVAEKKATSGFTALRLAVVILFVLVFYPRLGTQFATKDDTEVALAIKSTGHLLTYAWNFAVEQGRFSQFFFMLGLAVPYLIDSAAYYYAITLSAILSNFLVFYVLMAKLFHSRYHAIFLIVFAVTFLQYNWHHNPITAYPFVYSAGFTCFLLALFIHLRSSEAQIGGWKGATALLYLGALLTSEAFVPCGLLFLFVTVFAADRTHKVAPRFKTALFSLMPISAALACYLVFYVVFKLTYPSHYEGVQLSLASPSRVFAVVFQYAKATLPTYFYFTDGATIAANADTIGLANRGPLDMWSSLRVEWVVKALLTFLIIASILLRREARLSWRAFAFLLPTGFIAILLPVSLLGLSAKYQDWVINSGSPAYIQSYYTYFGTVFVLGLLVLAGKSAIRRFPRVTVIYTLVISSLSAVGSLATDDYNFAVSRDQQLSDFKWRALDQWTATNEARSIKAGAIIYAPSLWHHRGIVANHPNYWSDYLTWRTRKKLIIASTAEDFDRQRAQSPEAEFYFLSFEQEPKDSNQFIVLAQSPVRSPVGEPTYSTSASLFSYSKNKEFLVIGHVQPTNSTTIQVNGQSVTEISDGTFFYPVNESRSTNEAVQITMTSTSPVDASRLTLSYFPYKPRTLDFEVTYVDGFYGMEKDMTSTWNWSSGSAELCIWNRTRQPTDGCIAFDLVAINKPCSVTIDWEGKSQVVTLSRDSKAIPTSVYLVLRAGENKIKFRTDVPAKPAGNGDPRLIAFGIKNVTLRRSAR